jgi:hypothetical protein
MQAGHKVERRQRAGFLEVGSLPEGARIRREYPGEAVIGRRLERVEWASGWSW